MKSRKISFRIKGIDLDNYNLLRARLKYDKLFGEDTLTIKKAVELANRHLDLLEKEKQRIKEYWGIDLIFK
ncbi:MAG: hypothetical protein ACFFG0_19980 [Candidatus Thorarchaeota archaeon]